MITMIVLGSDMQVRCAAVDPERGRICTGARNGLLRLWDAGITA
jgi:hypothetical protein